MKDLKNNPRFNRRELLAGGVTFLALLPTPQGLYAAAFGVGGKSLKEPALPLFTALPYLQPGAKGSLLIEGQESIVIVWQTNNVKAEFTLDYGFESKLDRKAEIGKSERLSENKEIDNRLNYVATLDGLKLNSRYEYRVKMNGETLMEGFFTTRKPRGAKCRFVAFGDNSYGDISDRAIAYQAYLAKPDFVMNTGDNVYEDGLDNEYARYFFPVYNAEQVGRRTGAPLLRSIPYYSVIANHDVHGKDSNNHPAADFTKHRDSLAYFTNFHFPLNSLSPSRKTAVVGDETAIKHFTDCAGAKFPNMANYSYDYGDAHFLCLDSNLYVDPTDSALQAWVEEDLKATNATWKFVVYHHPAFNAGNDHYSEQHMRALTPLLEKHGVDITLHGHEHTYQRTRPMRFTPSDLSNAKNLGSKKRLIPGKFTIDTKFDGKTETKPNGVLYITTGAGGKHLYDPESNNNPESWLHKEDGDADYIAKFVSDRHSLTVLDMEARMLTLTQIDEWGKEIDRITISKG